MGDKLTVGRVSFGSTKGVDSRKLEKALKTLRNPAPGVTLVSHGWAPKPEPAVCAQVTGGILHMRSPDSLKCACGALTFTAKGVLQACLDATQEHAATPAASAAQKHGIVETRGDE